MRRKLHQGLCADGWSSVCSYPMQAATVHPMEASPGSAHSWPVPLKPFRSFITQSRVSAFFIFCLFQPKLIFPCLQWQSSLTFCCYQMLAWGSSIASLDILFWYQQSWCGWFLIAAVGQSLKASDLLCISSARDLSHLETGRFSNKYIRNLKGWLHQPVG